ncbi:M3 family metallopeptidase [Haliangium sp.]|uniref:M3 family metallopeptidase n=1 Tax=Haliangium sp. TaxID=2663208 RepID=UPI003D0DD8A4
MSIFTITTCLGRARASARRSVLGRRVSIVVGLGLGVVLGGACAASSPAPAPAPAPVNTGAAASAQPALSAPDFDWAPAPADLRSGCAAAVERARAQVAAVTADATEPGMTALLVVEQAVADLHDALIVHTLLASVTDDEDVRAASTECRQARADFLVELAADPAVYAIAEAARERATNPVDAQLARRYLEDGRRAGAGLDPDTRAQVTALFEQLGVLQRGYMQAMGRPPTTIEITAAEAASLPASFVSTLSPGPDGGYVVPVHYGTRERFLTSQTSGEARRRYWNAFLSRGGQANVERLEQALSLRHQLAGLLGFESWAAYKLDAKMAQTPARALALVEDIGRRLLPRAREEIAHLAEMKAAGGDPSPFAAWDYYHYREQQYQTEFGVDAELVRLYFPVDYFVPAVLGLYAELLGVQYVPLPSAPTWHPDVRAYAIVAAGGGEPVGWFYLDLTPRPGKSLHFSHFRLRAGRVLPGGDVQRPIAAVIGNGPPAEPGRPALLSHADAVIFFHEFGHLMHETLSTAPYASLFGTNVRHDFAEAPSQMFENWMWDPDVLARVSRHVDTGEPLPRPLIDQMVARKQADVGQFWTRQAFFAVYDLTIHRSGPSVDTTALWFDLAARMTALPQSPDTRPHASFAGFMGGYDAGYYGYLWSKVFAQDMFSRFREAGLANPEVGLRYRRAILEPGATREPDELLQDFLGRPVQMDAFYESVGLGAASSP